MNTAGHRYTKPHQKALGIGRWTRSCEPSCEADRAHEMTTQLPGDRAPGRARQSSRSFVAESPGRQSRGARRRVRGTETCRSECPVSRRRPPLPRQWGPATRRPAGSAAVAFHVRGARTECRARLWPRSCAGHRRRHRSPDVGRDRSSGIRTNRDRLSDGVVAEMGGVPVSLSREGPATRYILVARAYILVA